eukprot:gb/GEZN01010897.1/.p1 GENE.gb/GEZN01010897.1/~~gb/GEZN01010897.1/.p1  ORF type:complete len:239 (-),score=47.71 gb/GEZN01010897.1/:460-1176(-)
MSNDRRPSVQQIFDDPELIPSMLEVRKMFEAMSDKVNLLQHHVEAQDEEIRQLRSEFRVQKLREQDLQAQIEAQRDDWKATQVEVRKQKDDMQQLQTQVLLNNEQHLTEMEAASKATTEAVKAVTQKMREAFQGHRDQIQNLHEELRHTKKQLDTQSKAMEDQKKAIDIALEEGERSKQDMEMKLQGELAQKVGLGASFIVRTLNPIAIQAHQRFWKGEKMVIDRFDSVAARDPEDWR